MKSRPAKPRTPCLAQKWPMNGPSEPMSFISCVLGLVDTLTMATSSFLHSLQSGEASKLLEPQILHLSLSLGSLRHILVPL